MTSLIQARLLGAPVIKKDGKEIFFPYNKVNALVYYLLVKGTVMRDELSGVLWADKPDAIEYLKEHFPEKGFTATKLRTDAAFLAACEECGVQFTFTS